ncbi:hypothetical protein HZC21_06535 [Candidatus Peregrinibacteria bacterium]|nr:hypothetical protein [Candidatus Peregrinibacteria bacterium]
MSLPSVKILCAQAPVKEFDLLFSICYAFIVNPKYMLSRRNSFFSPYLEFPYFTKEVLRASADQFGIPESTFNSFIAKALKNGEIVHLKRNHYVARTFFEKHRTDSSYLFFLANALLEPSYVSLEAALQYYGLFAEAVNYTITSVTTKLPRQFKNRTGIYFYRNITESLFTGFKMLKENFEFALALPHKAIFDYLYYRTNRFTKNVHADLLEEFRIDSSELSSTEKENLRKLVAQFTFVKISL